MLTSDKTLAECGSRTFAFARHVNAVVICDLLEAALAVAVRQPARCKCSAAGQQRCQRLSKTGMNARQRPCGEPGESRLPPSTGQATSALWDSCLLDGGSVKIRTGTGGRSSSFRAASTNRSNA